MIKEKFIATKYNYKKNSAEIVFEYIKTIICSVLIAFIITGVLAFKARNEMIEDIFANNHKQSLLDKKVAEEIIIKTDLLNNLRDKSYSVCMHAGEICEIAYDYKDAQMAYELAIQKAKSNTYKPYYHLLNVLVKQEKFEDAFKLLEAISDVTEKNLIKFKTRSYLTIGDKYYSIGKFLSAAKAYEQAEFYYNKFSKQDKKIVKSINNRIINSYIKVADVMVQSGLNTDAVRFLKKAEAYDSKNFELRYKMAIVLSDLDPEKSVEYFEELLKEKPQDIDYGVYNRALMKAANIADLDHRPTRAKYYRYKIHSIDLFINRKVIYKNDVDISLKDLKIKKVLFKYPINATYELENISNSDIKNLSADFVLCYNGTELESVSQIIATKKDPLYTNSQAGKIVDVKFNRKIYTKKELEHYTVKIYLYKDPKYKTLTYENKIYIKNPNKYDFL